MSLFCAAQSSCGSSKPTTIRSPGDAAAIAACTTYSGDITIATDAAGDLAFNTVRRITGDINAKNAPNVTSISGDSLEQVDGTWTLNNLQRLTGLNFPQLTSVGEISWVGLANLVTLSFGSEISQTDSFNLQNTFLSDLTGINLKMCKNFYLANNRNLQAFSMQLQNVTGYITIQSNGNRMNVTFPNLQWAQNITIVNVPSISMPSLYAVNGSLGFLENEDLTSITLPNLTRVDDSLSINNNDQLRNFSIPRLTAVTGAVNVQNNTLLKVISFPKLETVGGAFDVYGNFTK